jgi:hypothetical protein
MKISLFQVLYYVFGKRGIPYNACIFVFSGFFVAFQSWYTTFSENVVYHNHQKIPGFCLSVSVFHSRFMAFLISFRNKKGKQGRDSERKIKGLGSVVLYYVFRKRGIEKPLSLPCFPMRDPAVIPITHHLVDGSLPATSRYTFRLATHNPGYRRGLCRVPFVAWTSGCG